MKWRYLGVLHEYIECMEKTHTTDCINGNYYTVSGRKGNRSKDENKYLKDAIVLEKAYAEALVVNDPIYNRYSFYCANSYFDCGKYEEAIKWYKITLTQNNWVQEKYICCLKLFYCYREIKQIETGMFYLIQSWLYEQQRVECIYELVSYYCMNGMPVIAFNYYQLIQKFFEEEYLNKNMNDKLFFEIGKYNMLLPFYVILVADKVKKYDTVLKMFRIVFIKKYNETNKFFIGNLLYNLQFFIDKVDKNDDEFFRLFKEYIEFLKSIGYSFDDHHFMDSFEKYGIIVKTNKKQPTFTKEECAQSNKILIFTGFSGSWGLWNYSYSIQNPMGGSETAVAYLANSFPKNYEIYVSGEVQDEKYENVTYINTKNLKNLVDTTAFHTIIVSRYLSFYEKFYNFSAYNTFIWAHDTELIHYGCDKNVVSILNTWKDKITGCICQTNWHKNLFLNQYPMLKEKIYTINNGLKLDLFNFTNKKVPNRFMYSSCVERGLNNLIELWPQILQNLPDAELFICTYNNFPRNDEERKLSEKINSYGSITNVGKLDKLKLYELMSTTEYWLYPTNFNETSCITAMEMLMSEVICLYYPLGGLVDTMGDYGIQIEKGNEIEKLLELTTKQKVDIRKRGKEYALSCSWENRAKEWLQLINNKCLSDTEKHMFYLHETRSVPLPHVKILQQIGENFAPNVFYDIGSSVLHWTKEVLKIWNDAQIIAFDAFEEVVKLYKTKNIKYHIGVLSDVDNKVVKFYENNEQPGGNSYYKEIGHPISEQLFPEDGFKEKIAMTLETVVKQNNYLLPDIVKIDVQGSELDILRGGMNIINNAKYLIIELQHTQYNRGAPLANVTIDFLNEAGWEILEEKFFDNGPDADYLFINKNYSPKIY